MSCGDWFLVQGLYAVLDYLVRHTKIAIQLFATSAMFSMSSLNQLNATSPKIAAFGTNPLDGLD